MIRVNALAWVKSPEKHEYVIINVEPENKFVMPKIISLHLYPQNYFFNYRTSFKLSFQLSLVDTDAIRKESLFLRGAGDCTLANKALNSSFQLTVIQGLGFWETAHLPLP